MSDEQQEKPGVDFISRGEYDKLKGEADKLARLVQNLNEDNSKLKTSLEAFGDFSPSDISALKKQLKDTKTKAAANPDEVKKLLEEQEAELRKQFGAEIAQRDTKIQELSGQYKQVTVVSRALNAAGNRVNDDMKEFIAAQVKQFVDSDDDGKGLVVKDETGKVRYSPTSPATKMSLDEFFGELENKFPSAFAPKGITKGSPQIPGRQLSGPVINGADKIDLEKFRTDVNYRESVPRAVRTQIYKQLGV